MNDDSELAQVASEVSDEEAGLTPEAELARHNATMVKVLTAMADIAGKISLINRAMATSVTPCLKESPMGDAIDMVAGLNGVIESVEECLKPVKAQLAFSKEVTMPERMDAEKVTTFNTERYRVTKTMKTLASIPADARADAYAYLRADDNLATLITETVNSSSLSAAAKEIMEQGRELPEDLFKVYIKSGLSITRKK